MNPPTITQIRAAREDLDDYIVETPVWQWQNQEITEPTVLRRRLARSARQARRPRSGSQHGHLGRSVLVILLYSILGEEPRELSIEKCN